MNDPKILICYDGSTAAKEAVERTAQLHPASDVTILCVWQPMAAFVMSWGLMAGDLGHMDNESRAAAERVATEGATLARAAGLYPHTAIISGSTSIAHAILDWCTAHEPKLVVVGATGHSTIGDAITGSVANAIVHRAQAPVLVVRCEREHHDASRDRQQHAVAAN